MARQILRRLHHNDAKADEYDGVKPQLAIGIGVVDATHHPAVMDEAQKCVEHARGRFDAERDEHGPDKNGSSSDKEQPKY